MTSLNPVTISTTETNEAKSPASSPRATAAAQEFESVLIGQWLTSAESSFGAVPGSEQSEDAGANQMNEFAMQHLASEIAKRGGIGIARLVESGLMKSNTPPANAMASVRSSESSQE